jgi:mycothiol S-conjugate amidase
VLRLLAVHAHPDDESSKGAATYAYYRSIGARVAVVSCTGGERGSILNDALAERVLAERDLPGLRRLEMARAQEIMGIEHHWLGYEDSGLPENGDALPANCFAVIPVEISAWPLVRLIREFRPHVIVAYDENGGYPHPDHIRAHEIAMLAFTAAADESQYPDAGPAWQTSKLYYDRIFSAERAQAVHAELLRSEPEHPFLPQIAEIVGWMESRQDGRPSRATTRVEAGAFFDVRDAALRSHASQVEPSSPFFFWPNGAQRAAWPYEEFELVKSLVPTELPETDLFAGIATSGTTASGTTASDTTESQATEESA